MTPAESKPHIITQQLFCYKPMYARVIAGISGYMATIYCLNFNIIWSSIFQTIPENKHNEFFGLQ